MITAITKEEFFTLFPGKFEVWELLNTKPRNMHELLTRYLPSKLWRLNNLYWITDKYGEAMVFKMKRAQWIVYAASLQHSRLIILKSRQQGISTLWLVSFFDDTICMSNFKSGLMAQERESAETLLERVKFLWDNLDPAMKARLNRKIAKNNSSEFSFNNNSTLYVRTSFRSATLQRLHVSELGKIANKSPEKAKETKTGSLQAIKAGNTAVIESTAEGANMFKQMWDTAVAQEAIGNLAGKDFKPVFLSWLDDPDCVESELQIISPEHRDYFTKLEAETGRKLTVEQKNFWIVQERELEGMIHQEYPATPAEAFAAAKDGTYWARRYIEKVIRRNQKRARLYDVNLPIYLVMDLGRSDYMVLNFFQYFEGQMRIVHEYYNSGEGLEHYATYIKNIAKERKWRIAEIALPHDAEVSDLSAEDNKTRQEILADYGITNTIVLAKNGLHAGIEAVRQAMPNIWIDEDCVYIEKCMLGYTKEWNDLLNIWRDMPKKNEWAHGADTVRYMVQYTEKYLSSGVYTTNLGSQSGGVAL